MQAVIQEPEPAAVLDPAQVITMVSEQVCLVKDRAVLECHMVVAGLVLAKVLVKITEEAVAVAQ